MRYSSIIVFYSTAVLPVHRQLLRNQIKRRWSFGGVSCGLYTGNFVISHTDQPILFPGTADDIACPKLQKLVFFSSRRTREVTKRQTWINLGWGIWRNMHITAWRVAAAPGSRGRALVCFWSSIWRPAWGFMRGRRGSVSFCFYKLPRWVHICVMYNTEMYNTVLYGILYCTSLLPTPLLLLLLIFLHFIGVIVYSRNH